MSPFYPRDPETHQPIRTLGGFDDAVKKMGEAFPLPEDNSEVTEQPINPALAKAQSLEARAYEKAGVQESLFDPNAREPSEAAQDQGWKRIDPKDLPKPPTQEASSQPASEDWRISDEDKEAGRLGLAALRAAQAPKKR